MSLKKNKIATLVIISLLICSFISTILIFTNIAIAESGDTYTVWLSSDPQIASVRAQYSYTYWEDAVSDANSVGVNISFVMGDLIHGHADNEPSSWSECIWEWGKFHQYYNNLNTDIYKNYSIGNHDVLPGNIDALLYSWRNHSWIDNTTYPYGNYTYTWGNILFIVLATENQNNTPDPGTFWYQNQSTGGWFDSVVTNNTDKNIFVMCHHPPRNTIYVGAGGMSPEDDTSFKATMAANDHVRAWFSGHYHTDNQQGIYLYENTTIIDCDCINGYGTRSSVFLTIQEGNSTVEARAYNHGTNAFASIGDLPDTFELKHDFTTASGLGTDIEIISVDNMVNGSTVHNANIPTSWTIHENASMYRLLVANDSAFTDIVLNLSNVSEANFPAYYSENTTHVVFTLPPVYELAWFRSNPDYYYIDVTPYLKQ